MLLIPIIKNTYFPKHFVSVSVMLSIRSLGWIHSILHCLLWVVVSSNLNIAYVLQNTTICFVNFFIWLPVNYPNWWLTILTNIGWLKTFSTDVPILMITLLYEFPFLSNSFQNMITSYHLISFTFHHSSIAVHLKHFLISSFCLHYHNIHTLVQVKKVPFFYPGVMSGQ